MKLTYFRKAVKPHSVMHHLTYVTYNFLKKLIKILSKSVKFVSQFRLNDTSRKCLSSGAAGTPALPPLRDNARRHELRSAASAFWSPSATSLSRSATLGLRALSRRARAAAPPRLRLSKNTLGVGQTRPRGKWGAPIRI